MRTTVKLRVPYPDTADAGDGLQVFTDAGSGTVDTTKPLLQRRAELFPKGLRRFGGLGTETLGEAMPGNGAARRPQPPGLGSEVLGVTPCGESPSYRELTVTIRPAFGLHKFEARMLDEAGNPQGEALPLGEFLVSSETPPNLRTFALDSYDAGLDRFTFSFTRNLE